MLFSSAADDDRSFQMVHSFHTAFGFIYIWLDTQAGFAVFSSGVANLAYIRLVRVMVLSGAPYVDQQT